LKAAPPDGKTFCLQYAAADLRLKTARQMQQIDKTSRRAGFWIFRAEDDARQMRI